MWFEYRPYVPVAQRKAQAAREVAKRRKKGQNVSPVVIEGRTIAHTFWGKAWCDNLESYSDFENRLPRGRSYVRNGSVVDLQIAPGKVTALVSGSELYKVSLTITPLPEKEWRSIKSRCAGQIGSVVELLQGKLSKSVIGIVTSQDGGLFPKPREISMSCSCPDWAGMCKHVAAVAYGIGARLDHQPELLFLLRKVDHLELIEEAVAGVGKPTETKKKTLSEADVAGVFGIELAEETEVPAAAEPAKLPKRNKVTKPKPAAKVVRSKAKPVVEAAPEAKPASKTRRAAKPKKSKEG
jgi:uncharacterized Zn finger protein